MEDKSPAFSGQESFSFWTRVLLVEEKSPAHATQEKKDQEMGKTKFRLKNKLLGCRKKSVERLPSHNLLDELTIVNKSARAKKFDLMDVDLDSFCEKEDRKSDTDYFTFAKVGSLSIE